jgi:transcriptional regulator with XRE-family HTH domain
MKSADHKRFGTLVANYRKNRLGISQEQLAIKIKSNREYIASYEGGLRSPSFDMCMHLSNIFKLTEKERGDFLRAAVESKVKQSKNNEPFFSAVGKPSLVFNSKSNEEDTIKNIPIFNYPKKRIAPPFLDIIPESNFVISDITISDNCYAVLFKESFSTNENPFRIGDMLIIDPVFEMLQNGDWVLVEVHNEVSIKRYSLFQTEETFNVQFLPAPPATALDFFDFNKDNGKKFEIFGKVVLAIKKM